MQATHCSVVGFQFRECISRWQQTHKVTRFEGVLLRGLPSLWCTCRFLLVSEHRSQYVFAVFRERLRLPLGVGFSVLWRPTNAAFMHRWSQYFLARKRPMSSSALPYFLRVSNAPH